MREMIRGAMAKGNRTLVVAHRREIVEQTHLRFARGDVPAGIVMAGHMRSDAYVQVGSIQTLSRRTPVPGVRLLAIDEAHHAKAKQYEKLLEQYPEAVVVGLTASPWRLDGRGLGDIFGSSVVAATPRQLIREGYLCDYTGFAFVAPDLSEVKTVAGDWDEKGLSLAYAKSTIYADIIEKWSQHAKGRQTIVFAASIESSEEIAARFQNIGVQSVHVDFRTPGTERVGALNRVRSGEVRVICNVSLLGEGIDLPELSCAILARPTKSLTVYLQQVGRVMRPKQDGSKALILDHAGNVERHGLPDAERDYSLTTTKPREVVPALHTCKSCFAIWEGTGACPECGTTPAIQARTGPEVSLAHQEVDIRKVRRIDKKRRDELVRLLASDARRHGMAPGWVVRKLNEKMPGASFPAGWWRANVAGGKRNWRWA